MNFALYEFVKTSPLDCVMWGFCCGLSLTALVVSIIFLKPGPIIFFTVMALWAIFAAQAHVRVLNRSMPSREVSP